MVAAGAWGAATLVEVAGGSEGAVAVVEVEELQALAIRITPRMAGTTLLGVADNADNLIS